MMQNDIFMHVRNELNKRPTQETGKLLAQVFRQESLHGNTYSGLQFENIDNKCSILRPPWNQIFSLLYKASHFFHVRRDYSSAFHHMSTCLDTLLNKYYRDCDDSWIIPLVKIMCLCVRKYATSSYFSNKNNNNNNVFPRGNEDQMNSAVNLLYKVNRVSAGQESKRPVVLHLANQIFKIFFQMRNLNSTKQLVGTVENLIYPSQKNNLPTFPFERYPKSERVTWNYFSGVVSMFENRFTRAEQQLSYSFRHCAVQPEKNKRMIFEKLIVVRLVMGKVPTKDLLMKYGLLKRYGDIVWAYRQGNLERFDRCLNEHYKAFFAQGTYLILHHARMVVYRNFFRKAVQYYLEISGKAKNCFIKFDVLNRVFNKMFPSLNQSIDETECVLSTLIYKGYIRGYLSHQRSTLVIANLKNAFPQIKLQHQKR